jgi:WhiB family redox-sensing transcriptional regulator
VKTTTLANAGWPSVSDNPDAACKQHDPGLFFGETGGRSPTEAEAKQICWSCPIRVECLRWAVRVTDLHGVWGATSQSERENWRRNRGK